MPLLRPATTTSPGRAARSALLLLALALAQTAAKPSAAAPGAAPDPLFDEADVPAAPVSDPLERSNRAVFRFNLGLDRWALEPITSAYDTAVPSPGRRAIRRALANLAAPAVFVNDVLQFEGADASLTAVRFAINTTFGILGLFDVAASLGLEGHSSDFGQTLALYGVPSGPYLILPVVGPTNARDASGYVVDVALRPLTYILGPGADLLFFTSIEQGTVGITARDAHSAELQALRASSMDYYASLRSAYAQNREAEIWGRRADGGPIARLKWLLNPTPLASPRRELVDAGAHRVGERGEALALED